MSAATAPPEAVAVTDAASFAAATGADAAQMRMLGELRTMLLEWNAHVNLVSAASLAEFWSRHAFDSAQLLRLAPWARTWMDIGAGAGFPGLVLAVFLKGRGGAKVHLVESQAKRCRFLAAASEALGAPAEVHCARAEDLALEVEVVTARAVAPLTRLLGYAKPAMDRGAIGLFPKGVGAQGEIDAARRTWRFDLSAIPSLSDPGGRILKVERLRRVR